MAEKPIGDRKFGVVLIPANGGTYPNIPTGAIENVGSVEITEDGSDIIQILIKEAT